MDDKPIARWPMIFRLLSERSFDLRQQAFNCRSAGKHPGARISSKHTEGIMRILLCFDGTSAAEAGLKIAETHAAAFNARIYVVTSLPGGTHTQVDDVQRAEEALAEVKTLLSESKIECETHLLVRGLSPGEDLVQFAKENDIDEIVIGVKKKSKVGKFVFGSTAQYVILEAGCPVVTVK